MAVPRELRRARPWADREGERRELRPPAWEMARRPRGRETAGIAPTAPGQKDLPVTLSGRPCQRGVTPDVDVLVPVPEDPEVCVGSNCVVVLDCCCRAVSRFVCC